MKLEQNKSKLGSIDKLKKMVKFEISNSQKRISKAHSITNKKDVLLVREMARSSDSFLHSDKEKDQRKSKPYRTINENVVKNISGLARKASNEHPFNSTTNLHSTTQKKEPLYFQREEYFTEKHRMANDEKIPKTHHSFQNS
jgi:hypothetical protein